MASAVQCNRCSTFEVRGVMVGWMKIWTGESLESDSTLDLHKPLAEFCPDCSKEFEAFLLGVPIAKAAPAKEEDLQPAFIILSHAINHLIATWTDQHKPAARQSTLDALNILREARTQA